jgi:DNA-directed RNA polymerase
VCMPRAQVYAALNAIGEVAWSINGPVVDALKHAWDEGMRIGNMPIQEDLPLTPTPPQRIFAVQSHTYPRTRMTVSVSAVPSQRILRPSLCLVDKLSQGRLCSH